MGDPQFVAAAVAEDMSFAIAYVPKSRPLGVDFSRIKGQIGARWFDPVNGGFVAVDTAAKPTQPPATNSGGEADWVLLVE